MSRERQDEFAARSHQLAHWARELRFCDDLVAPIAGVDLTRDEGIRAGSTPEVLAGLRPVFRTAERGGTITEGDAGSLNDGASAVPGDAAHCLCASARRMRYATKNQIWRLPGKS
ncbi:hypothetical protein [Streptomyces hokutonensis]|uniref:thiolase family protein n=1 Tax=Streptomyces hokutonensis TaxID=1306990 RepID=UPI0036C95869